MRKVFAAAIAMIFLAAGPAICWGSVTMQSASVSSSGGGALFTSIGAQTQQASQVVWPAALNLPLLASLPPTLVVNFPDRASATLTRMRGETRNGGAYLWTGNGGGCTAVMNVVPTNVIGIISCLTGNYSVTGIGQSLQLARFVASNSAAAVFEPDSVAVKSPEYVEPQAVQPSGTQVDTTVDVLVLYSDGVRQYVESQNMSIRQFAQSAIDMVQTAMTNSASSGLTLATVRLAGLSEVSRTATGDLGADQTWLDNDPEPQGLRNFWAADVVMYLTLNGSNGEFGLSNVPGYGVPLPGPNFAPLAHSSLVARCAVLALGSDCSQPYVFGHEIAHLFGANHNPENNANTTPLEPYAFANWHRNNAENNGTGARTLVSYYVSGSTGCADTLGQCATVLYYSNAAVSDDWFKTGVGGQRENARVISEFQATTAQYRLSLGRIFYDGFQY